MACAADVRMAAADVVVVVGVVVAAAEDVQNAVIGSGSDLHRLVGRTAGAVAAGAGGAAALQTQHCRRRCCFPADAI